MVATVRCEEIANERVTYFKDWCELEEAAQNEPVKGFGKKLSLILGSCLSEYDAEATFFDEGVRTAKRKFLEEKLLQLVQPAFHAILGHLRTSILEKFKDTFEKALKEGEGFSAAAVRCTQSFMSQFDEGCADAVIEQAQWDTSKAREKLHRDIDAHVASVRSAKLSELTTTYEGKLTEALAAPVEALIDSASDATWPSIRSLLQRETQTAISGLSNDLSSFDMDEQEKEKMIAKLEHFARNVVETKARKEASRVLIRMKDRFGNLFTHDSDSMPRLWTGNEDIREITKYARSASLKLLSVMAVIRLDDDHKHIENTLSVALVDGPKTTGNRSIISADPLASSTWEKVPSSSTLLSPVQCKSIWRQFNSETEYTVSQAISAQEANQRNSDWVEKAVSIAMGIALSILLRK